MKFKQMVKIFLFLVLIFFSGMWATFSRGDSEGINQYFNLGEVLLDREKGEVKEPLGIIEGNLPIDYRVTIDKLENGLTYYIRENREPENRAVLLLVIDAGSVLEQDDQRGIAHFVEHMAFNGTVNLKKEDIVDYLEKMGMRFGPGINASTGYDSTEYILEIPTEDIHIMERAFFILSEWASNVIFSEKEVERERKIIIEEWREEGGAGRRIREKHIQVLFEGSRYSKRDPIGLLEVIKKATSEDLKKFYRTWYRPELMTVIAVGDFDKIEAEKLIKKYFSPIASSDKKVKRPLIMVPDHQESLYSIVTDPEAENYNISLYIKKNPVIENTVKDYRRSIIETLYTEMLNRRLEELTKKPDPPFVSVWIGKYRLVRSKEAWILHATVREGGIEQGLYTLLVESERALRFGFNISELEREKKSLLRMIEQFYLEKENIHSNTLADEYVRHFLESEPIPGIECEYMLFNQLIPGISLQEVNDIAIDWFIGKNRVVLVSGPEKVGVEVPDREALEAVFEMAKNARLTPYQDKVVEEPLVSEIPAEGYIKEESYIESIGITILKLSNGARVILKPTDFKADEVLFQAFSPGGHSLVPDSEFIPAITAPRIIEESGIGNFNSIDLEKRLSGKLVSIEPWIGELFEGFDGSAALGDLKTLFELIYLYFTSPRRDEDAYKAYKARLKTYIENRRSNPEEVFWDTVRFVLEGEHFRARPLTEDVLKEMDIDTSYRIFRQRFLDAGDFYFVFIGSFDIEEIKPLILSYIGGIPTYNAREKWRDLGIDPPQGIVKENIYMGVETKSQVQIVFSGSIPWSYQKHFGLVALAELLDIRIREKVREEKGGAYTTWVWAGTQKYPDQEYYIYMGFGCAPERVEELTDAVFREIGWVINGEIEENYIIKVREILKRELEKSMRENEWWIEEIATSLRMDEPLEDIIKNKNDVLQKIDSNFLKEIARLTLKPDQYIRVVLLPENFLSE